MCVQLVDIGSKFDFTIISHFLFFVVIMPKACCMFLNHFYVIDPIPSNLFLYFMCSRMLECIVTIEGTSTII